MLLYQATPGGPAAHAGIRGGDVLLSLATHRLESVEDLHAALRDRHAGERIKVSFARGEEQQSVEVLLLGRSQ